MKFFAPLSPTIPRLADSQQVWDLIRMWATRLATRLATNIRKKSSRQEREEKIFLRVLYESSTSLCHTLPTILNKDRESCESCAC
jgi:hypothetical protein